MAADTTATYIKGADLPDLAATWLDDNGNPIDFSTGWTFTVELGLTGQTPLITKTSGVTGDDLAPNITIAWALHELDDLDPNKNYEGLVTAVRTSDHKERKMPFRLFIKDSVG